MSLRVSSLWVQVRKKSILNATTKAVSLSHPKMQLFFFILGALHTNIWHKFWIVALLQTTTLEWKFVKCKSKFRKIKIEFCDGDWVSSERQRSVTVAVIVIFILFNYYKINKTKVNRLKLNYLKLLNLNVA